MKVRDFFSYVCERQHFSMNWNSWFHSFLEPCKNEQVQDFHAITKIGTRIWRTREQFNCRKVAIFCRLGFAFQSNQNIRRYERDSLECLAITMNLVPFMGSLAPFHFCLQQFPRRLNWTIQGGHLILASLHLSSALKETSFHQDLHPPYYNSQF